MPVAEYYVKLKGPDVKFEDFEDYVKKNGKSVDTTLIICISVG